MINDEKYTIITPIAKVFKNANIKSGLETELLFGDVIQIKDKKKDWVFCKNFDDQYHGWINEKVIGSFSKSSHFVSILNTIVFSEPNIKSLPLLNLPYNSKVNVNFTHDRWSEISLKNNFKIGYIPVNHISDNTFPKNLIIKNSKYFLNVPYLWGGKSYLGIDCSGLIQLIHQTSGQFFPRNSNEQMEYCKNYKKLDNIQKGALVFWEGHVALAIDDKNIIHANAFHMNVTIENFIEAKNRISNSYGDVLNIYINTKDEI